MKHKAIVENSHLLDCEVSKAAKDILVGGGAALIWAQVLCLVNKEKRNCPLLHLNLGTLEVLLYVDDVGGVKEFSCLSKSHLLNTFFCKSNHFIHAVPWILHIFRTGSTFILLHNSSYFKYSFVREIVLWNPESTWQKICLHYSLQSTFILR